MATQKTLNSSFKLEGITLHSGMTTSMIFHPAPPDSGIVFRRTDITPYETIKAAVNNVSNTDRCTQLSKHHSCSISMVEHVLSALRGMGVDNVIIEVNGKEIPVLDGSAVTIAERIKQVSLSDQKAEKRCFRLKKTIRVEQGKSYLQAVPCDEITYSIVFKNDHNLHFLTDQTAFFNGDPQNYLYDIAPARTFGFEHEVEYLKTKGLIKGASTENAVLIGNSGIISNLRYQDEFARHKLLDVIGDLALIPPFWAKIEGQRTSHHLNTLFAKEILKQLY
ncbi:UDP-3-O-acyl-N-acetylglucosamine deacetylase [Neobacillus mesonae]|nr:UDP-3-O-acyl-N-acetylglucosamine deacetylase [Neobacillus mesonae]